MPYFRSSVSIIHIIYNIPSVGVPKDIPPPPPPWACSVEFTTLIECNIYNMYNYSTPPSYCQMLDKFVVVVKTLLWKADSVFSFPTRPKLTYAFSHSIPTCISFQNTLRCSPVMSPVLFKYIHAYTGHSILYYSLTIISYSLCLVSLFSSSF